MAEKHQPIYMSLAAAARILGITPKWFRHRANRGDFNRMEFLMEFGGKLYVDQQKFLAYLDEHHIKTED